MKGYSNTNHLLFLFIIFAGAALRFYDLGNLMFTFDEFSALFRTGFDDFRLLIQKGVVEPDTHPAGVQVFLNYWVKLTGHHEMLIKLPFILMGMASIFLIYQLGTTWFNPTVGLIGAMFLAFLQYPVTYTVFARPYASGLFFTLLMIVFWSRAFIEEGKKMSFGCIAGYIVSGALCAYNHYFSLFLLGLVGLSGLFAVERKKLLFYVVSNIAIFILFIPHLRIFFIQLGKGGVGSWLSKPEPMFFIDYLQYILHFSKPMYLIALLLLVLTFIFREKHDRGKMKLRILLSVWILITWLTGYFYSVYVNPVLQYSVLIFTYPLLVILTFSFVRDLKPVLKIIVVGVFFSVSLYSLIFTRQHFSVLYSSGYREIPELAAGYESEYGKEKVTTLFSLPPKILDHYMDQLELHQMEYTSLDSFGNPAQLKTFLAQQNSAFLTFGCTGLGRMEYLPILLDYYPNILNRKSWFLCDLWFLSKEIQGNETTDQEHVLFSYEDSFVETGNLIHGAGSADATGYRMGAQQEYFSLYDGKMIDLNTGTNNLIVISVDLMLPDGLTPGMIVSEMRAGDELFDWRSVSFNDFHIEGEVTTRIYMVANLADLRPEGVTDFKTFIWNKHADEFHVLGFKLEVWRGNPILYGLYERIGNSCH
jgi:hypothetical protein